MTDLLQVTLLADDHGLVVQVAGELDMLTEPRLVENLTRAVTDERPTKVVLDLTGVTFIDSSGLRGLLRCRDAVVAAGATLSLTVTEGVVTRLFKLAGVTDWFTYT